MHCRPLEVDRPLGTLGGNSKVLHNTKRLPPSTPNMYSPKITSNVCMEPHVWNELAFIAGSTLSPFLIVQNGRTKFRTMEDTLKMSLLDTLSC